MTDTEEKLVLVETTGSVLWFVMDGCWMLNEALLAKGLIGPTLLVNLMVFRYTKPSISQLSVVAAMNAWLLMNILWMVGDLNKDPGLLQVARWMFAAGLVCLVTAVIRTVSEGDRLASVLARFRKLRV